jgi:hypothetical protein
VPGSIGRSLRWFVGRRVHGSFRVFVLSGFRAQDRTSSYQNESRGIEGGQRPEITKARNDESPKEFVQSHHAAFRQNFLVHLKNWYFRGFYLPETEHSSRRSDALGSSSLLPWQQPASFVAWSCVDRASTEAVLQRSHRDLTIVARGASITRRRR